MQMLKSLFDKYLNFNLLPFCFRLCPTVSEEQREIAETTGINQTQIRHRIRINLFYNNELWICFHGSGEDK